MPIAPPRAPRSRSREMHVVMRLPLLACLGRRGSRTGSRSPHRGLHESLHRHWNTDPCRAGHDRVSEEHFRAAVLCAKVGARCRPDPAHQQLDQHRPQPQHHRHADLGPRRPDASPVCRFRHGVRAGADHGHAAVRPSAGRRHVSEAPARRAQAVGGGAAGYRSGEDAAHRQRLCQRLVRSRAGRLDPRRGRFCPLPGDRRGHHADEAGGARAHGAGSGRPAAAGVAPAAAMLPAAAERVRVHAERGHFVLPALDRRLRRRDSGSTSRIP